MIKCIHTQYIIVARTAHSCHSMTNAIHQHTPMDIITFPNPGAATSSPAP